MHPAIPRLSGERSCLRSKASRCRSSAGREGAAPAALASPSRVVVGERVFVQDMKSNVLALDLATGRRLWEARFDATNQGPDGVAVSGRRVFGATDSQVFVLSALTGHRLSTQRLVNTRERFLDIAPLVSSGPVFVATIGVIPNGQGALYGLNARSGRVVWRFSTIRQPWQHPGRSGGGGAWFPPSVAGRSTRTRS